MRFFHTFDVAPTWAPLERLRTLVEQQPDIDAPDVERYMYMGTVVAEDESVTIHLFKHVLTRRYLNVDDNGHAYVYVGGDDVEFTSCVYKPLPDLGGAIEWAQGEVMSMSRAEGFTSG